MKCALCKKEIKHYSPEFNHLEIDDALAVDICRECIDKFMKWQQAKIANLFPTKALKKRYGEGTKGR